MVRIAPEPSVTVVSRRTGFPSTRNTAMSSPSGSGSLAKTLPLTVASSLVVAVTSLATGGRLGMDPPTCCSMRAQNSSSASSITSLLFSYICWPISFIALAPNRRLLRSGPLFLFLLLSIFAVAASSDATCCVAADTDDMQPPDRAQSPKDKAINRWCRCNCIIAVR